MKFTKLSFLLITFTLLTINKFVKAVTCDQITSKIAPC